MALNRHQLKKLRILTKKVKLYDNEHLIKCKIKQADLWMWEDSSEMSESLVSLFNEELERRLKAVGQHTQSWDWNHDPDGDEYHQRVLKLQKRFKEALEF